MTKQEEIRKGMRQIPLGTYDAKYGIEQKLMLEDYYILAILNYLHSQGVVIKVDRELPSRYIPMSYGKLYKEAEYQKVVSEAGYVATEPLITEGE